MRRVEPQTLRCDRCGCNTGMKWDLTPGSRPLEVSFLCEVCKSDIRAQRLMVVILAVAFALFGLTILLNLYERSGQ